MSLHALGNGRWEVRWRDEGRNNSRTFYDEREATLLEAQISHARRQGIPMPIVHRRRGRKESQIQAVPAESPTLSSYLMEPYGSIESYYIRKQAGLSRSTRKMEAEIGRAHV